MNAKKIARASRARSPRGRLVARVRSPQGRFAIFAAFLVLVALFGGASRGDVVSLVFLRPLAIVLGAIAFLASPPADWHPRRLVLTALGLALFATAWQLVPLPPEIWHSLPGRGLVERSDALLGLQHQWRPAALSPDSAWNAFFAVTVCGAAVLVIASLDPGDRARVPAAWLAVAAVSAALGILQAISGPGSVLYTYAVTNQGLPVGLFANANHQAVFLSAAIPVAVIWACQMHGRSSARRFLAVGLIALFAVTIFLADSRAGTAMGILSLIISLPALAALRARNGAKSVVGARASEIVAKLGPGAVLLAVAGTLTTFLLIGWLGYIDMAGLLATAQRDEVRFQALPIIMEMWETHWLAGTGGGAFAAVYQAYEPVEMLTRYYLNQAHNDWLQVPLEYGILGLAMLGAMSLAFLAALRGAFGRIQTPVLQTLVALPGLLFALASVVDYPLRTPLAAGLFIVWTVALRDIAESLCAEGRRKAGNQALFTKGKA